MPRSLPSRPPRAYAPLVACLALSAPALAQLPADVGGAWEGPWDWEPSMQAGLDLDCVDVHEMGHAALVPTGVHAGKVLMWNWVKAENPEGPCPELNTTIAYLFDPAAPGDAVRIEQKLASDVFCGGHSWTSDGKLLVAGGIGPGGIPHEAYQFDPSVLEPIQVDGDGFPFIPVDRMKPWRSWGYTAIPRYYPTLIALNRTTLPGLCESNPIPGGSIIALGGPWLIDAVGEEYWEVARQDRAGWYCPLAPREPFYPAPDVTETYADLPLNDPPEVFFDGYPRAFQLSSGEILVAHDVLTADPYSQGPIWVPLPNTPGRTWIIRPPYDSAQEGEWQLWRATDNDPTPGLDPSNDRMYGNAVLMHQVDPERRDRVLVFNGSMDTTYFAADPDGSDTDLDRWQPNPLVQEYVPGTHPGTAMWARKDPMVHARIHSNAVMLPTGQALVVGGGHTDMWHGQVPDPIFQPELFDPGENADAPGTSRLMNQSNEVSWEDPEHFEESARTPRLYHHVSLLLPDGRVFVAGGDHPDAVPGVHDHDYPDSHFTGELFSPPYLFEGFRPTLHWADPQATLADDEEGEPLSLLVTTTVGVIDEVVLLRPGAVTHHFDNDQRYIELEVVEPQTSPGTKALEVLPPHESLGPPGYYMIFVVERAPDGRRVPSVGRFVRFD